MEARAWERQNLSAPHPVEPQVIVPRRPAAFPLRRWAAILMAGVCLLPSGMGGARAATEWQIVQQKGSDLLEVSAPRGGNHKLEIDDAFGFRTPVVKKTFSGSQQQFRALDLGLIPGIDYHARLDGGADVKDFRIEFSTFTDSQVSCTTLRRTWEQTVRRAAGDSHSRVGWDAAKSDWVELSHGPLIGQALYYVEYYLRPTLTAARACNDFETLDEIAKYYLLMLQLTEPVGTLLKMPNLLPLTRERMAFADQSARTFPADIDGKAGDADLYNSQWLHPAAEFLRLVSLMAPARRTPAMQSFAGQYTRFIVVDQLDRYLVQQRMSAPGGGEAKGRIELWKIDMSGRQGDTPWANKISDIDLWLIASAAEVLGANANDPALVPLDAHQTEMLHSAVDTGTRFFESERNEYPTTKNFQGQQVGSISYCNGEYADHSGYEYSAVNTEKIPTPAQKLRNPDVGWDIMHSYRIPVFLRALYENRKATGVDWPPFHEVQLFANQYVYRVFNGDFSRPLFKNYLDGSDGWEDVRGDFGYPPSPYCDQHDRHRPCTVPASIMGWGRLAFANPDLAKLEHALVKLALDPSLAAKLFRDRYYFDENPFEMLGQPGQQIYAMQLYFVIGDNAGMIRSMEKPN